MEWIKPVLIENREDIRDILGRDMRYCWASLVLWSITIEFHEFTEIWNDSLEISESYKATKCGYCMNCMEIWEIEMHLASEMDRIYKERY